MFALFLIHFTSSLIVAFRRFKSRLVNGSSKTMILSFNSSSEYLSSFAKNKLNAIVFLSPSLSVFLKDKLSSVSKLNGFPLNVRLYVREASLLFPRYPPSFIFSILKSVQKHFEDNY